MWKVKCSSMSSLCSACMLRMCICFHSFAQDKLLDAISKLGTAILCENTLSHMARPSRSGRGSGINFLVTNSISALDSLSRNAIGRFNEKS